MNIDINAAIQRMNKEQEQDREKMQGIKTLLGQLEREKNNGYEVYFGVGTATQYFNHQWWNAPYKGV